jgi:hypothetical protein
MWKNNVEPCRPQMTIRRMRFACRITKATDAHSEYVILIAFPLGRACSTYGGKREVHTGFWWGDLREGDHLGDPGVDGRIIVKWIFKKWDGAWTGLS